MSRAIVKFVEPIVPTLCGECGVPLVCVTCSTGDVVALARLALSEVVRGVGGRGAQARVTAALAILDKDYLSNLSDEDLLAEVKRRAERARKFDSQPKEG